MNSKEFTTLIIRLALGLIYMTAGFSKLSPDNLGNIIGPVDLGALLESKTIHTLMIFAAIYQIIAGAIILSQRYSVFGLVLLFPLVVGILIFTTFAGFGATSIINLFILLLLLYATFQERKSIIQILKLNFNGIKRSTAFELFPNKVIPKVALGIVLLTTSLSFLHNPVLNVLCSIALILFTINLFQVKNYLVIDKVIIVLFLFIGLIIINGILLNQMIPKAFYSVFALIPIGFTLYFIRLIYWRFSKKKILD